MAVATLATLTDHSLSCASGTVNTVITPPSLSASRLHTVPPDADAAAWAALTAVLAARANADTLVALSATQWLALLGLADTHDVGPRLYVQMTALEQRYGAPIMPDTVRAVLHGRFLLAYTRNTVIETQTQTIVDLLQSHTVAALVLKGPTLATLLYGSPGGRVSSDIDVLIRPRDRAATLSVLTAHGYAPIERAGELHDPDAVALWYIEAAYGAPDRVAVDVHWYPYGRWWHRLMYPLDGWVAAMFAQSQPRATESGTVCLPGTEDDLLFLALHAARDNFSRLAHLADLDRLVAVSPALDWTAVIASATRYGVRGPVYYALWLTQIVLGTPIPPPVLEALQPPTLLRRAVLWLRFGKGHTVLSSARIAGTYSQRQVPAHLMLDSYADLLRCCRVMLFPGRTWLRQRYSRQPDFGGSLIVFHLVYYLLTSVWRTIRYVFS